MLDARDDLVLEPDEDADVEAGLDRAQGIGALYVMRVVDDHDQDRPLALYGYGANLAQEIHAQALAQVLGHLLIGGEAVERDAVVTRDGLFDFGAGDADLLDEVAAGIGG